MWQVVVRNQRTQARLVLFVFDEVDEAQRLAVAMQRALANLPTHTVEITVQWEAVEGKSRAERN